MVQLWQIWSRTPFGTSKDFQEQIRLRGEVVRMKRELAGISAQDDFAKWAKLRRQHDKAMEEHDKRGKVSIFVLCTLLTGHSRRRWVSPHILRHQGNNVSMDVYERRQVCAAILACEDTDLHVSTRVVSLAY